MTWSVATPRCVAPSSSMREHRAARPRGSRRPRCRRRRGGRGAARGTGGTARRCRRRGAPARAEPGTRCQGTPFRPKRDPAVTSACMPMASMPRTGHAAIGHSAQRHRRTPAFEIDRAALAFSLLSPQCAEVGRTGACRSANGCDCARAWRACRDASDEQRHAAMRVLAREVKTRHGVAAAVGARRGRLPVHESLSHSRSARIDVFERVAAPRAAGGRGGAVSPARRRYATRSGTGSRVGAQLVMSILDAVHLREHVRDTLICA